VGVGGWPYLSQPSTSTAKFYFANERNEFSHGALVLTASDWTQNKIHGARARQHWLLSPSSFYHSYALPP
jgi:hypothetical protein